MDEEQNTNKEADNLSPGYRFYPTEEELLYFYLQNKLDNQRDDMKRAIPIADAYNFDPWQLPRQLSLSHVKVSMGAAITGEASVQDSEQWFFFCHRHEREIHGGRPACITPSGYWKATGSSAPVYSSANRAMDMKKTMVFYRGRVPTGSKTKWKMNEYISFEKDATPKLRRVYIKSGCLRLLDRQPSVTPTTTSSGAKQRMVEGSLPTNEDLESAGKRRSRDSSSSNNNGSNSCPVGGDIDLKMLEQIKWDLMDCV